MEFPTLTQIYDDYKLAGEDFEYLSIAFGNKPDLTDWVNDHPEFHCTEWLFDPLWESYTPYRIPFGLPAVVPCHFIVDRDGYIRYGKVGGIGSDATILTDCIDELL